MEAPPLPSTVAELDQWSVYADALLERADPFGDFLRLDLALPASPTTSELDAFHAVTVRRCRDRLFASSEWLLGMARTLIVRADVRRRVMSRTVPPLWAGPEALADAADLVRRPHFARLEALRIALASPSLGRFWTRLVNRLPPSCRRLELDTRLFNPDELQAVATQLPDRFSELRLTSFSDAVLERLGPRLTTLELACAVEEAELRRLDRLAPRCEVIVHGVATDACLSSPRVRLGRPGDGVFTSPETGAACVLSRTTLDVLQRSFGVVGARAQLSRTVPEAWWLRTVPVGVGLEAAPGLGSSDVMRHPDGSWTISSARNANTRIEVDRGTTSTGPTPLLEGMRVHFSAQPWRFSIAK